MGDLRGSVRFLSGGFTSWPVIGVIAPTIYGLGVAALFGDEYFLAASFFIAALAMLTVKIITNETTRVHESSKIITALILMGGIVTLILSIMWINHRVHETGHRWQSGFSISTVLALPGINDSFFIAVGIVLVLFIQGGSAALRTVSPPRERAAKGRLDYKLQAEEAMAGFGKVGVSLAKVMENAVPMFSKHTRRVSQMAWQSTRKQLKEVKLFAVKLNRLTGEIDVQYLRLQNINVALEEGIRGWFSCIPPAEQAEAALEITGSLRGLIRILDGAYKVISQYVDNMNGFENVSQDLNDALIRHRSATMRVGMAIADIRDSCSRGLEILGVSQGG